ncbi:MAG TPA: YggS family pyridoxal phosphate-dependent enzyme [Spirochaetia bacterium]|jgi:pyridoxal phosphate enzyme (YggS family)|nr:YggS family pyridoxal phosphate-dependent enzyme [Spirochaetia bacterium]
MDVLKQRLLDIEERIQAAAIRSGRDAGEVEILAVTKTLPFSSACEAYALGLRLFGENRVQEAAEKYANMKEMPQAKLHLIGHLQRNKARDASLLFDCVESIDKAETAFALNSFCEKAGKTMDILLEVNTSLEATKSGFADADSFFSALDVIQTLSNLRIRGLMTVGPLTEDKNIIRASFASLRSLRDRVHVRYPDLDVPVLSMGMSHDFEIAIEEGSTRVRIGTALFGPREYGNV